MKQQRNMKLTTIYLGTRERRALKQLSRATGKNRSECMRLAIREAADILREHVGYQIRGVDNVLRCDSGVYEKDKAGNLRCVHCQLPAA